ncbi:NADP transhydrogenase subunit beta [Desulfosarcina widdelii]|uniref:proton-translocating NAD(P)(+) transhydrogenase n=1 Tax=Desulfosarcina widdelii TaxID=947919 RepID=A0A5K7Z809_9BACT|nr:NAD(P)(+) transhydrogenase (Re/Si-specific) subunit beta [Desulfosarcina widdelii]BBO75993.1 NADP transhydrogenase subunit beta [Desulfosarcina widdelii]
MNATQYALPLMIDFAVIVVLISGIWQFRAPRGARTGNLTAALALLSAFVLVLYRNGIVDTGVVVLTLMGGGTVGYAVARAVSMIQIPAMVAFQHGVGGVAAFLVSLVELTRNTHTLDRVSEISGLLGLTIGALTFSGSMVASAKLSNRMRQTQQTLPGHHLLLWWSIGALFFIGVSSFYITSGLVWVVYLIQILLSVLFGILFSIRIGGADMPVLISFLNATAGLAASFCGMVIGNQLLIAFGATVAASGSILTHVMCKAMNRNLFRVFFPETVKRVGTVGKNKSIAASPPTHAANHSDPEKINAQEPLTKAVSIIKDARTVIVVPGYGMALAKAQTEVSELANQLIAFGKTVRYAIHPVAGRMPGHMNVLLAEAGVDYEMLVEMEAINPEFQSTDLVLVVGACDVVNPAAIDVEGTPISGMPILITHEAKNVVCCNFDEKPGYSGVENPLYSNGNTILLTGDAKKTVQRLLDALAEKQSGEKAADKTDLQNTSDAVQALAQAKRIVIIPGYGMALAKAQFDVVELGKLLERKGVKVNYAIHPVAGRMPGHMNVLLAEADVDYENLIEMDEANPGFAETDVAMVVGACDVVNPSAIKQEGTPISGMPILMAHQAKKVIVCNLDKKPGYSGVENPLYDNENTIMLLGDAKLTTKKLIEPFQAEGGWT